MGWPPPEGEPRRAAADAESFTKPWRLADPIAPRNWRPPPPKLVMPPPRTWPQTGAPGVSTTHANAAQAVVATLQRQMNPRTARWLTPVSRDRPGAACARTACRSRSSPDTSVRRQVQVYDSATSPAKGAETTSPPPSPITRPGGRCSAEETGRGQRARPDPASVKAVRQGAARACENVRYCILDTYALFWPACDGWWRGRGNRVPVREKTE
jgi:hypothetical protein